MHDNIISAVEDAWEHNRFRSNSVKPHLSEDRNNGLFFWQQAVKLLERVSSLPSNSGWSFFRIPECTYFRHRAHRAVWATSSQQSRPSKRAEIRAQPQLNSRIVTIGHWDCKVSQEETIASYCVSSLSSQVSLHLAWPHMTEDRQEGGSILEGDGAFQLLYAQGRVQ